MNEAEKNRKERTGEFFTVTPPCPHILQQRSCRLENINLTAAVYLPTPPTSFSNYSFQNKSNNEKKIIPSEKAL